MFVFGKLPDPLAKTNRTILMTLDKLVESTWFDCSSRYQLPEVTVLKVRKVFTNAYFPFDSFSYEKIWNHDMVVKTKPFFIFIL